MISSVLKALINVRGGSDGDWNDRLNHRVSCLGLIVLGILVSTKQYVGDPINCWCPAHFTRDWVEYANNYCWISNTYYIPFDTYIEKARDENLGKEIKYYQWVPLILCLQALFFYAPYMIWRYSCMIAGIDLASLVDLLNNFDSIVSPDVREKTFRYAARYLDKYLSSQWDQGTGIFTRIRIAASKAFCVFSRKYGNYLFIMYIWIKSMYLLNAVLQLFFLNTWLGEDYWRYGLLVTRKIIHNFDWTATWRFPRVTMCDFEVRTLGNLQTHTVQCVLSINLFNEKIYLFVWFWLVFVAIVTTVNFFEWIVRSVCFIDRLSYIKKHLKFMDRYKTDEDRKMCKRFVNMYLRPDGVFLIRLLAKNTNSIIVSELVAQLWDMYRSKPAQMRPSLHRPSAPPSFDKLKQPPNHLNNFSSYPRKPMMNNPNEDIVDV